MLIKKMSAWLIKLLAAAILSGIVCVVYVSRDHTIIRAFKSRQAETFLLARTNGMDKTTDYSEQREGVFLVDTPTCKIPDLDPHDASVARIIGSAPNISCSEQHAYVYQEGHRLFINWTAVNQTNDQNLLDYCQYEQIFRPEKAFKNEFKYVMLSDKFRTSTDVEYDYVRVECFNTTGSVIYKDFFAFLFEDEEIEKSCNEKMKTHQEKTKVKEPLSVLMLGIDSISRINFHRFMPKTTSYLLKTLGAIEFKGYNKVADNTFVNVVPLTTGKFVEELPWNESMRSVPFDKHNFLWKQYRSKGYRTLYIEDAPEIAIFDFGKAGFYESPTHHFNRAFAYAMEKDKEVWYNGHHCVHNRLETDIHLDYLKQFLETHKSKPYFAFSFLTRLTHYTLEQTHYAENSYYEYLKMLNENKLLENTVLIFYSDHGMRFGYIREKYIGKLEERLPGMFIKFPDKFLSKYPLIHKNLVLNSRRLTSPFDIYETLVDLLYFNSDSRPQKKSNRGISLFEEIPLKRTCQDAGILPHWCTCALQEEISNSDQKAIDTASILIEYINAQQEKHQDVCAELSLHEIKHVRKIVPSDKLLRFKKSEHDVIGRNVIFGDKTFSFIDYEITVKTDPGGALFEGTVRFDEVKDQYNVMGDVSRINMYGNQSHCVSEHRLKKFCYCKVQPVK